MWRWEYSIQKQSVPLDCCSYTLFIPILFLLFRLWREPSTRTPPCSCVQRLSFLMESLILSRKSQRSDVKHFFHWTIPEMKTCKLNLTLSLCVLACCTLQDPDACGCLSGRFSHSLHDQGWFPTCSIWLQVKRCYQHLCWHPQGKECFLILF